MVVAVGDVDRLGADHSDAPRKAEISRSRLTTVTAIARYPGSGDRRDAAAWREASDPVISGVCDVDAPERIDVDALRIVQLGGCRRATVAADDLGPAS